MLLSSKSAALEKVGDKIKSIDWTLGDRHLYSNVKLLQEHFHRLTLWCSARQKYSYWPQTDMFDLFNIHVDDETEREEIRRYLEAANSNLNYTGMRSLDKWFHWLLLQEYASKEYPHLPDPYEPLIRMYERGGTYYLEHGFIYIGTFGYSFAGVRRSPEDYLNESFVSSLDDATLNALDK